MAVALDSFDFVIEAPEVLSDLEALLGDPTCLGDQSADLEGRIEWSDRQINFHGILTLIPKDSAVLESDMPKFLIDRSNTVTPESKPRHRILVDVRLDYDDNDGRQKLWDVFMAVKKSTEGTLSSSEGVQVAPRMLKLATTTRREGPAHIAEITFETERDTFLTEFILKMYDSGVSMDFSLLQYPKLIEENNSTSNDITRDSNTSRQRRYARGGISKIPFRSSEHAPETKIQNSDQNKLNVFSVNNYDEIQYESTPVQRPRRALEDVISTNADDVEVFGPQISSSVSQSEKLLSLADFDIHVRGEHPLSDTSLQAPLREKIVPLARLNSTRRQLVPTIDEPRDAPGHLLVKIELQIQRISTELSTSLSVHHHLLQRSRSVAMQCLTAERYLEVVLDIGAQESEQLLLVLSYKPPDFSLRVGQIAEPLLMMSYQGRQWQAKGNGSSAPRHKAKIGFGGWEAECVLPVDVKDNCHTAGLTVFPPTSAPAYSSLTSCKSPTLADYHLQLLGIEEGEGPSLRFQYVLPDNSQPTTSKSSNLRVDHRKKIFELSAVAGNSPELNSSPAFSLAAFSENTQVFNTSVSHAMLTWTDMKLTLELTQQLHGWKLFLFLSQAQKGTALLCHVAECRLQICGPDGGREADLVDRFQLLAENLPAKITIRQEGSASSDADLLEFYEDLTRANTYVMETIANVAPDCPSVLAERITKLHKEVHVLLMDLTSRLRVHLHQFVSPYTVKLRRFIRSLKETVTSAAKFSKISEIHEGAVAARPVLTSLFQLKLEDQQVGQFQDQQSVWATVSRWTSVWRVWLCRHSPLDGVWRVPEKDLVARIERLDVSKNWSQTKIQKKPQKRKQGTAKNARHRSACNSST
ncbi:hypothetical protein FHG87_001241 [Trinorchestia longiramus]|nr:hypothetical protein FHG87_001241 [Trinorchestia longiramus]